MLSTFIAAPSLYIYSTLPLPFDLRNSSSVSLPRPFSNLSAKQTRKKMSSYSKIGNTHKSRLTDFSNFPLCPQTPKSIRNHGPSLSTKPEESAQMKNSNTQKNSSPKREEEGEKGEIFGVILGRSSSVSSSSAGFQATMKRAFSMRRSSSVSERYCRIHDQYMALAPAIGDDERGGDEIESRRSMKKHRGGKILKACKRLIGL